MGRDDQARATTVSEEHGRYNADDDSARDGGVEHICDVQPQIAPSPRVVQLRRRPTERSRPS